MTERADGAHSFSPLASDGVCLPPEEPFVTLSHAWSWVLARTPIGSQALAYLRSEATRDLEEAISNDRIFRAALKLLLDAVCEGKIALRGKLITSQTSPVKAITQPIPPASLHDFSKYHIREDGLALGQGIVWPSSRLQAGCSPTLRTPFYISVMVERAALMIHFPPPKDQLLISPGEESPVKALRSPAFKRGRAPHDEAILQMADEMRGLGLTGYEIASRMRLEPGFADVPTVRVRELIRGRWPRGPRTRSPAE